VIFTKSITGYVNCVHRWSETKWLSARFEYTNESDRSLKSWTLWALWAWIGPQPIAVLENPMRKRHRFFMSRQFQLVQTRRRTRIPKFVFRVPMQGIVPQCPVF